MHCQLNIICHAKHKQKSLKVKNNIWEQAKNPYLIKSNIFKLIKGYLDDCQMNIEPFFKF